jgi:hypothetical protein
VSHVTGTVQVVSPALGVGPAFGVATSPGTWAVEFAPTPAPSGTKLLMLHFSNAQLPAGNRLEVDLGYGTDVFTAADGSAFWTRPVNPFALPGGRVPIRYLAAGAPAGGVQLDRYGRGERHGPETLYAWNGSALSNCDPFLPDASYLEPVYDPFWYCADPPRWENARCVQPASDIRASVARSVGMVVSVHGDHLGTCSVTLVGPDVVLTAGHCLSRIEATSSSVTFDYAVECDGSRPAGYTARFHKVIEVVRHGDDDGSGDYCLLRLAVPPGGIGLPSIQLRHDLPAVGERIFGVHHPNGAVKKLSVPHPAFDTVTASGSAAVTVPSDFHVSGGSSGSGLFDAAGRIVGVLANGDPCGRYARRPLAYFPTATIVQHLGTPPPGAVATRDVMVLLDRSGSMSAPGASGRPKIDEARDALSLFVQLVRSGTGNRVGLASFSTTAHVDAWLALVSDAAKAALVGPPPFAGGIAGTLVPDGTTSIGAGIDAAGRAFLGGGPNPDAILLLTDGLQNTPPLVADVERGLGGIAVEAIGYGTEASLDGALLSRLASDHGGMYARADTSLRLEKFFAQAFGNIFESGLLQDPDHTLAAGVNVGEAVPFDVCGEERITVVVGWDRDDEQLALDVATPGGTSLFSSSPGTEHAAGRTWRFLRIPLPVGGERDGRWSVRVRRVVGPGEIVAPGSEVRYFLSVVASGGPRLVRIPPAARWYTGDAINPIVQLRYDTGGSPGGASASLTVRCPTAGAGNLLAQAGLGPPGEVAGDAIPARNATLMALEQSAGGPLVGHVERTFALSPGPASTGGWFRSAGRFGVVLDDLLKMEGDYTFHARATYGEDCRASREVMWSVHVDVGVDPAQTTVDVQVHGSHPAGGERVTITIHPRDRFGNSVGPGHTDDIVVSGAPGTSLDGGLVDNGDGSYGATGVWQPLPGGSGPGLVVGQPGRPPVVVQGLAGAAGPGWVRCWPWIVLCLLLAILAIVLLILLVS